MYICVPLDVQSLVAQIDTNRSIITQLHFISFEESAVTCGLMDLAVASRKVASIGY